MIKTCIYCHRDIILDDVAGSVCWVHTLTSKAECQRTFATPPKRVLDWTTDDWFNFLAKHGEPPSE